jgi:hypothetical protein
MDFEMIALLVGAPVEVLIGGPLLVIAAIFLFSQQKPKEADRSLKEVRRRNAMRETPIFTWGSCLAALCLLSGCGYVVYHLAGDGTLDLILARILAQ